MGARVRPRALALRPGKSAPSLDVLQTRRRSPLASVSCCTNRRSGLATRLLTSCERVLPAQTSLAMAVGSDDRVKLRRQRYAVPYSTFCDGVKPYNVGVDRRTNANVRRRRGRTWASVSKDLLQQSCHKQTPLAHEYQITPARSTANTNPAHRNIPSSFRPSGPRRHIPSPATVAKLAMKGNQYQSDLAGTPTIRTNKIRVIAYAATPASMTPRAFMRHNVGGSWRRRNGAAKVRDGFGRRC
jgi:hypothetical protein